MTNINSVAIRRSSRIALNVTVVAALLVTTGCGLEVCDVVNCDTLFFVEELVEDLEALGADLGEEDHDEGDQVDEIDEHLDDMDDHEDDIDEHMDDVLPVDEHDDADADHAASHTLALGGRVQVRSPATS